MSNSEAEERHAAIVASLEGDLDLESVEDSEEFEAQSEEGEADAPEVEEEYEEEDAEPEESFDDDEGDVEEGHRVPYDRFKQINDRRHQLQSQLEEREQFIAELEGRLEARREPEPTQGYEYEETYNEPSYTSDIDQLRQQNHEIQVKFATMELEKEVASAVEQYPNVPKEYIWDSIAQDGTQNASMVASQYSDWVAEVEEAAIARYLAGGGADEADAPPRPSRKQSASSSSEAEDWQPQTTDEAREAMLAFLRS